MEPAAKKPSLAIVVGMGKGKPKPEGEAEEAAEGEAEKPGYEPDEGQAAAGSDLADAVKSGDGAAIAKAFMALRDLCC